jgi:nicotinamide-nucleotide amidase
VEQDGDPALLLAPSEMKPMFEEHVMPRVRELAGGRLLLRRILKIASMSESDVDQALAPLYRTFTNPRTTILSAPGQVELHLTAEGASEAEALGRLEELAAGMRDLLPGRFFSEDDRELPEVVAAPHQRRAAGLAESCWQSAGPASPGAGQPLPGRGFVTSNRAKVEELGGGARPGQGAVSRRSRAMAAGARRWRVEIGVASRDRRTRPGTEQAGRPRVRGPGRSRGARVRRPLPGNHERIRYRPQAALRCWRGLPG